MMTAAELTAAADKITSAAKSRKNLQLTGGHDGVIRALTRIGALVSMVRGKDVDKKALAIALHARGFNVRF